MVTKKTVSKTKPKTATRKKMTITELRAMAKKPTGYDLVSEIQVFNTKHPPESYVLYYKDSNVGIKESDNLESLYRWAIRHKYQVVREIR